MKWPWQTQTPPLGEPELTPAMKKRLDELEERCAKTEKAVDGLDVEWSEWFDKFRLLYARLSKRMADAAPEAPEPAQDDPGSTITRAAVVGAPRGPRRNY